MNITNLSDNPNAPCFIATIGNTCVMLDCGLDMQPLLNYLPQTLVSNQRVNKLKVYNPGSPELQPISGEFRESNNRLFIDAPPEVCTPEFYIIDVSDVDAVLISNYHHMMALPYLTKLPGFRARVYGTEPTLQFGQLLMEELATFSHRVYNSKRADNWKSIPSVSNSFVKGKYLASWRRLYTLSDIEEAVSHVEVVSYDQHIDLHGGLTVVPRRSGYALGSANWTLEVTTRSCKLVYLSSSSVLTTHAQPLDQPSLLEADLLLVAGLSAAPNHAPDAMMSAFCNSVSVTLNSGGSVLVPCYPTGTVYDLLERLWSYLDTQRLSQTPIYLVSPVSDSCLAYSDIYAEWLAPTRQAKVYQPEVPFLHSLMNKGNRLKHFANLHEGFSQCFRTPCVLLCSHPSLRLGDSVHFLNLWGSDPSNTVVFIEPDFPYIEAVGAYQPLFMRASFTPIDVRLTFNQLSGLLEDLRPGRVVASDTYTRPGSATRSDLQIRPGRFPLTGLARGQSVSVPIQWDFECGFMSRELCESVTPVQVGPGGGGAALVAPLTGGGAALVAPLTADITRRDSILLGKPRSSSKRVNLIFGKIDCNDLLVQLKQADVGEIKLEETSKGYNIHLQSEYSTLINIEANSIHVINESNENIRVKIKEILIKMLNFV